MKFPDDFTRIMHPIVPGATQWTINYPNRDKVAISIVGGGIGLYGDGVRTFEMYDFRDTDPQGYLTKEEINEYLKHHPFITKHRKLSKRETNINTFYKFLIDNDAFVEYRENVRKSGWFTLKTIFNEDIIFWIARAFPWTDNWDYWCTLGVNWQGYVEANNIEK